MSLCASSVLEDEAYKKAQWTIELQTLRRRVLVINEVA